MENKQITLIQDLWMDNFDDFFQYLIVLTKNNIKYWAIEYSQPVPTNTPKIHLLLQGNEKTIQDVFEANFDESFDLYDESRITTFSELIQRGFDVDRKNWNNFKLPN